VQLRSRALQSWRPWASADEFEPLTDAKYASRDGVVVTLDAPIEKVQAVLFKAMRPYRKELMAIRIMEGSIQELKGRPYRDASDETPEAPKPEAAETKAKAVTVAQPVAGCPMPDFPEADVRASRVLETFLTEDQVADYRNTGAFISVGADSGRRYLICNRERPRLMAQKLGGRQLLCLDTGRPLCVHDWEVPPPEEMLAIHLMVTLPGRETQLAFLPEYH